MPTSTTSATSSGGVLQSLGVGSGIDISTLVSELTTAEMAAPNARIKREQESVTTQVSAIASLKSALSTFQSSLSSLLSGSGFSARNVSSSDDDVLTATTTAAAALGRYQITVQDLAQSQQLLSNNFAGGATAYVGTGTLSFSSGGKSFEVALDSTSGTLAGIRDAINSAPGNQSVSATLVYGQNGAQLVLSSLATGAAAAMTVTSTGGDGGLAQLTYGVGNTANFTEQQEAQDAVIFVSGVERHSATNQISNAIDGVTLNIKDVTAGTPISLNISNDKDHVISLVNSFITAYNTLQTSTTGLDAYNASTQEKGPLFGDAMYVGLRRQMRAALSNAVANVTGPYASLAALGVTAGVDGTLSMNSAKLTAALNSDFKAVSNVLSGAGGVISRLNSTITSTLLTGGGVSARNASLKSKQASIDNEKSLIDMRTEKVKQRYLAKFNAMDSLLARLQNTGTFLTQQMDAMNRASKT